MRNSWGATALTLMLVASAIGGCGGEDDESASPRAPSGGSAGSGQSAGGESGGSWGELDAGDDASHSAAGSPGAAGASDPGAGGVGGVAGGATAGSGGVAGDATGGAGGTGGTGGTAGKGGSGGVGGFGGVGGIGGIGGALPYGSVTASFESAQTTSCYKGFEAAISFFDVKFTNTKLASQTLDLSGKLTLSNASSAVVIAMPIVPSSVTIPGTQTQVVSLKSPLLSVPDACDYCGHKATLSLTYELPDGTKKTTSIGPDKVFCN